MSFLTAIDEQLRRDPLGATWTDGSLHRPTRDLAPISIGTSGPIVTLGCLSDAEAIAAPDDRGLSMLLEGTSTTPTCRSYRRSKYSISLVEDQVALTA